MELAYLSGKIWIYDIHANWIINPDYTRFYALHKAYKDKVMIMHVDRHWHKFRLSVRNGKLLHRLYSVIHVLIIHLY